MGPYAPEEGHRFNPHKLVLDPYSKAIAGTIRWSDALFGYTVGHPEADLSCNEFGRTQQGNNNAYCQDNEISWVN